MSTVTAVIATTKVETAVEVATIKITLHTPTGIAVQTQSTVDTTVTFPNVADGDYQVSAVAVDSAGADIGAPYTTSLFTVSLVVITKPVLFNSNVPSGIAVTVSA